MYFDEMKLGMSVEVAPAVIAKDKMLAFAKEYDDLPLHKDEEYAKTIIEDIDSYWQYIAE